MLNQNPSTSREKVMNSEDVTHQNPEKILDSGEIEDPQRKRPRLDSASALLNCPMCRMPKELNELRHVKDDQESLPIMIGWYLAKNLPFTQPIINRMICRRHFPEAVTEIYQSLRITKSANISLIRKGGEEIKNICRFLNPNFSLHRVESALTNFCRENEPGPGPSPLQRLLEIRSSRSQPWRDPSTRRQLDARRFQRGQPEQGQGPSTPSSSAVRSPPQKPTGSRKRKDSERLAQESPFFECIVCSLSRPSAELQEIDKTHEELPMMLRCVLTEEKTIARALTILNTPGRLFSCPHHIHGTVREIYRTLRIRSIQELVKYEFNPEQVMWRLAEMLQKDITQKVLRDRLLTFCYVNEMRETNPSISYEDVDVGKIGEKLILESSSGSSGNATGWEDESETPNRESTSQASGVVADADDDSDIIVLSDSPPPKEATSSSPTSLCSICGIRTPPDQQRPLVKKAEKLAILIIWVIEGGLSYMDAVYFHKMNIVNQTMCIHHAEYTVDKIYEHLGVNKASSISTCRLFMEDRLMITARTILPAFSKKLFETPMASEDGLRQILRDFCEKHDSRESNEEDGLATCIICEEPKSANQLHQFENFNRLIVLIKRVLYNKFPIEKASTILQSTSAQFACHLHFLDTTTQMFASFKISRIDEILHCSEGVISTWMRVARILKSDVDTSVFKIWLETFCRETAAMRIGEQEKVVMRTSPTPPPPSQAPPTVPRDLTCTLCLEIKRDGSFHIAKQESEKQLLAIGWILMGKMSAAGGMQFSKREGPVLVCIDDYKRVINRVFVELKVRPNGDLPTCLEMSMGGRVMSVVHSLQPGMKVEVFRNFLAIWTKENEWSLELWKQRPYSCSLCRQQVSENEIIQLKVRRDTLVLMMAWIHEKGYAFQEARNFITTQKHVCKKHLKEAADIILKTLEIRSMDQMPTVVNEPLAKLLWYAQETGQRGTIAVKDAIGWIRGFFQENAEIIEEETPPPIQSPQSSTSSSSPIQILPVVIPASLDPRNMCMLCHERKEPNLLQSVVKQKVKLLLATGWMLMNKCSLDEARNIAGKFSFNVCEAHFAEAAAQICETLGIKSLEELESCTLAQKQKLMDTVNSVNLNQKFGIATFWEFLLIWNWENLKGSKESPQPPRILQDNICCATCQKRRHRSEIKYIGADPDKLVILTGCVLNGVCSVTEGRSLLARKRLPVCSYHCPVAIMAIQKGMKKTSDPMWMDSVMPVVSVLRPGVSTEQFSETLKDVMLRNKNFKEE